jgi:hypothetical protein
MSDGQATQEFEYPDNYPGLSGDIANQIVLDIGNGVAPEDSSLEYGLVELAFREDVERAFAAARDQNPQVVLDVRE